LETTRRVQEEADLARRAHGGDLEAFGLLVERWLMRIVANAATDWHRRRKVRATEELPTTTPTSDAGPDSDTDRRAFLSALHDALVRLPERQRIAVVLFDVEGYQHAEIADILKVPQGTVRSDVFHARRTLREALKPWRGWREKSL
jgi:RNA polymerase sigma-70 factor (ECF subfamily)